MAEPALIPRRIVQGRDPIPLPDPQSPLRSRPGHPCLWVRARRVPAYRRTPQDTGVATTMIHAGGRCDPRRSYLKGVLSRLQSPPSCSRRRPLGAGHRDPLDSDGDTPCILPDVYEGLPPHRLCDQEQAGLLPYDSARGSDQTGQSRNSDRCAGLHPQHQLPARSRGAPFQAPPPADKPSRWAAALTDSPSISTRMFAVRIRSSLIEPMSGRSADRIAGSFAAWAPSRITAS